MEKSPGLSFSWRAFLLAPWPAAVIGSTLMYPRGPDRFSPGAYVLFLTIALAIAYVGTTTLVVCLSTITKWRPVSRSLCAVTGLILAGLGYAPILFLGWLASGPDWGPSLSFFAYALSDWRNPILYLFLASGLGTALVYAFIPRRNPPD